MTDEGRDLKESYQWQAKSQWKRKPVTCELQVSVVIYFGTKRKADVDNFNKLWQDALTGIVYEDDSQITELTVRKSYDKENPRLEIEVNELP
jgi:Holliday junction resolvase RusA-like endonuclease